MYQNSQGSYGTEPNIAREFSHSCLGRIIIVAAILAVLLLFAHLLRPSIETMKEEMADNVRQSIESRDSLTQDDIDVFVSNVVYTFTEAEGEPNKELLDNFYKHNQIEYYQRAFYTSAHLYNNFRPEGIRCGIGILGMVIPLVDFNEFLFRDKPESSDYNQSLYDLQQEDIDLGDNPYLEPFMYNGE